MFAFRRISLVAVLVAVAFSAPAVAQQRIQIGEMVQRIDRLEAEVARLRVSPTTGSDVARLDQIESELRRLTGMIERLDFENRKLKETTDKRVAEFEARLKALEGTPTSTKSVSTAPPTPTYGSDPMPYTPLANPVPARQYAESTTPEQPIGQQAALSAPAVESYGVTAAAPAYVQPSAGQGPEQLYQEGLRLLNRGSFDEAGAQFEELIAAHPQDERSGHAQYWLGDMHFKLGRFEQAATAFLNSFRNWPEGAKAPDSLLKLGMTLATIGKREEACLSLSQVPIRYPSASPSLLRRANIEGQRAGCGS